MRLSLLSVLVFHEIVLAQPVLDAEISSRGEVENVRSRRALNFSTESSGDDDTSTYVPENSDSDSDLKFKRLMIFMCEFLGAKNPYELWAAMKDQFENRADTMDEKEKTFWRRWERLAEEFNTNTDQDSEFFTVNDNDLE